MSLIRCPECSRKKVSDTAVACPHCGYGIKEHFDKIRKEEEELEIRQKLGETQDYQHKVANNEEEQTRKKKLNLKYTTFFLMSIIGMCIYIFCFIWMIIFF